MLPEYVTEQSLANHMKGIYSKFDDLSTSINRVMDRVENHEGRITDTEVDVGGIKQSIESSEKYSYKRNTGRQSLIKMLLTIAALLIAGVAVWVAMAK